MSIDYQKILEPNLYAYANMKLTELLKQMGTLHTYHPQFLCLYYLIIWYKSLWCSQQSKPNKKKFFKQFNLKYNKVIIGIQKYCMCRGCDLLNDYQIMFTQSPQILNKMKENYPQQLIVDNKEYFIQEVEDIMVKTYEKNKQKWKQRRDIAYLLLAIKIRVLYTKKNQIKFENLLKLIKDNNLEEMPKFLLDLEKIKYKTTK